MVRVSLPCKIVRWSPLAKCIICRDQWAKPGKDNALTWWAVEKSVGEFQNKSRPGWRSEKAATGMSRLDGGRRQKSTGGRRVVTASDSRGRASSVSSASSASTWGHFQGVVTVKVHTFLRVTLCAPPLVPRAIQQHSVRRWLWPPQLSQTVAWCIWISRVWILQRLLQIWRRRCLDFDMFFNIHVILHRYTVHPS